MAEGQHGRGLNGRNGRRIVNQVPLYSAFDVLTGLFRLLEGVELFDRCPTYMARGHRLQVFRDKVDTCRLKPGGNSVARHGTKLPLTRHDRACRGYPPLCGQIPNPVWIGMVDRRIKSADDVWWRAVCVMGSWASRSKHQKRCARVPTNAGYPPVPPVGFKFADSDIAGRMCGFLQKAGSATDVFPREHKLNIFIFFMFFQILEGVLQKWNKPCTFFGIECQCQP